MLEITKISKLKFCGYLLGKLMGKLRYYFHFVVESHFPNLAVSILRAAVVSGFFFQNHKFIKQIIFIITLNFEKYFLTFSIE